MKYFVTCTSIGGMDYVFEEDCDLKTLVEKFKEGDFFVPYICDISAKDENGNIVKEVSFANLND